MDHPPHRPTHDLGVTDVEYERILRDLHRRGHTSAPAPPPVAPPPGSSRLGRRLGAAAVVLVAIVVLAGRWSSSHQDPAYAFLDSVGGHPVTYSSCQLIQVAVYPAGGPPDAEQLVREAVDTMRSATGLNIAVVGAFGGHAPNWNFKAGPVYPDDPIAVSWQDGSAIAELTNEIAGLGGSREITGRGGSKRYVAGTIALSRDYFAYLDRHHNHAEALAVLLHEFGHVLGLAHVDSSGELMYRRNIGRTALGPGDLEGLRLLGKGPCT
jgi:hypothetical protein